MVNCGLTGPTPGRVKKTHKTNVKHVVKKMAHRFLNKIAHLKGLASTSKNKKELLQWGGSIEKTNPLNKKSNLPVIPSPQIPNHLSEEASAVADKSLSISRIPTARRTAWHI